MFRFLFSLLMILALGLQPTAKAHHPTVSLVVDVNEDIAAQTELVQCVFDQLPEKLNVVEMPWKRGQIATEAGKVSGFFIAAKTEARDRYADYSDPLREISWIYILSKNSDLSPTAESFFDAAFASSRGTRRLEWLQGEVTTHNLGGKVEIVANATQGLSGLNKGQIEILLSNRKSYHQALFNLGLNADDFKTYEVRTIVGGVYFGHKFLQKHPDFLIRFNRYVPQCRVS